MLKILYAGCLNLSPAISVQVTLEMCVAAQNCKKITKTPYSRGSRSVKVIDVDISKKLVASASFISFRGPPTPSGMKFCHKILETLSYHMVKTRSLYL